jgi:hypothetical protein
MYMQAKASEKAGRRVWAWELDAPPGMRLFAHRLLYCCFTAALLLLYCCFTDEY